MKIVKHQSQLYKSVAAIIRINFRGLKIVTVICTVIVLSLCNSTYGRSDLKCGDEIRIEMQDGMLIQGKLRMNQNGLLRLSNGHKSSALRPIALSEVKTIYRIRRATTEGTVFLMLAGTAAGFLIAMRTQADDNQTGNGWLEGLGEIDERIFAGIFITVGGAIIGAVVGYLIGYNIQRLREVQLEAVPQCFSASGDKFLLKVNFAIGS